MRSYPSDNLTEELFGMDFGSYDPSLPSQFPSPVTVPEPLLAPVHRGSTSLVPAPVPTEAAASASLVPEAATLTVVHRAATSDESPVPAQAPVPSLNEQFTVTFDEAVAEIKKSKFHADFVSLLARPEDADTIVDVFKTEILSNCSLTHSLAQLVREGVVRDVEQFNGFKPVFIFLSLCLLRNQQTGSPKFAVAEVISF